jgi:hypothetical protein
MKAGIPAFNYIIERGFNKFFKAGFFLTVFASIILQCILSEKEYR